MRLYPQVDDVVDTKLAPNLCYRRKSVRTCFQLKVLPILQILCQEKHYTVNLRHSFNTDLMKLLRELVEVGPGYYGHRVLITDMLGYGHLNAPILKVYISVNYCSWNVFVICKSLTSDISN